MGTGTHTHDTAFSIVKALGIAAVVISHAAIRTPLETVTYYFNTAVFFFVAGYFFDDGQTAAPWRFTVRKLRRLYLPYVALGTLFVLLHNKFLEWHLIAYDFSTGEPILPYDPPELLRTLGRVFLCCSSRQPRATMSTSAEGASAVRYFSWCWCAPDATCSSLPRAASRHTATDWHACWIIRDATRWRSCCGTSPLSNW